MQRRFATLAPNAVDGARQPRDPLRVERVFQQDETVAVETLSQRAHETFMRGATPRSRAKPQHQAEERKGRFRLIVSLRRRRRG
jgi:hypothetical protein